MTTRTAPAPQGAQIQVGANGCRNIPTTIGIKLVRDLFEGIGVDRLRADQRFANPSFSDVAQLDDMDLTEAVAIGLDYLTADSVGDRSAVKTALMEELWVQFRSPRGGVVFRVGRSYSMAWPNHRTLMH